MEPTRDGYSTCHTRNIKASLQVRCYMIPHSGLPTVQQKLFMNERTDITPNRRNIVHVVSPNDAIHTEAEGLHDKPKREKADAYVP